MGWWNDTPFVLSPLEKCFGNHLAITSEKVDIYSQDCGLIGKASSTSKRVNSMSFTSKLVSLIPERDVGIYVAVFEDEIIVPYNTVYFLKEP